jgi:hypothetical protein
VPLPSAAEAVLEVRVNGLPQADGVDFFLVGRLIVLDRPLVLGGPPSRARRLLAACLGIHVGGDTVDARYRATDGSAVVAAGLDITHC